MKKGPSLSTAVSSRHQRQFRSDSLFVIHKELESERGRERGKERERERMRDRERERESESESEGG